MTDWERVEIPRVLFTARCTRCYHLAARFLDGVGWQRDGKCKCVPAPVLPQGDELARLIARALRMPAGHPIRGAITIRV